MEIVLALVLVAVLAAFVIAPLRSRRAAGSAPAGEDPVLADLEARKESLYRQIRDAQLDHEEGKTSDADYRRLDAELRAKAVDVLKEIDLYTAGR
jgi:hypothetical protein